MNDLTEMLWSNRPGFRRSLSILGFLFPGLGKYKGNFKVVHLETVREAGVKWLLHEYLLEHHFVWPWRRLLSCPPR